MRGFFSIIVFCGVVLIGAGCTATSEPTPQEPHVYGTNADPVFIQQSKTDCQERGGTFNECGSACAAGEICAAVCTAVCEFE